ncbi:MAG: 50S ribosomal protein L23 [Candidatus Magasanikbacteria bacterium]|jgi:large subunit ribosomal protein L23
MGLLDRWTKKKEDEKLKDLDKKPTAKPRKSSVVVKDVKPKAKSETKSEIIAAEKKSAGKMSDFARRILVKPLITEKAAGVESIGKYSFIVSRNATKIQIKRAVAEAYHVKPVSVNVANFDGRRVRFGRSFGRRSDYRKAIVSLAKGQHISIHEGV